jgi:anti-sigma regulatory factor (Ser/Thr protein kinase)
MNPHPAPVKPHDSYRHEAFLYSGDDELVAGLVPFILDGLMTGQPVMAALPGHHLGLLVDALGPATAEVMLVDMIELGHNPARIIPGWQHFLDRCCLDGRPVRGIGEPIWAGRRPAELLECQFHEALLNVAVDPDTPFWLRCPYDTGALDQDTVAEAHRSHPIVVDASAYAGSTSYTGAHHVRQFFGDDLPEPPGPTDGFDFGPDDLVAVRDRVTSHGSAAGLERERVWELALSVHEIATNSVRHGGGRGRLRIWHEGGASGPGGAVVCEVSDNGMIEDPLVGRRRPDPYEPDGRGLWLANQLCDLVQVRSTDAGAVVRIVSWR